MTLTTFSSGVNTSFSTELNNNFNYALIRGEASVVDTTEYTTTSTTRVLKKTFTFTPSETVMLVGVKFEGEGKNSNGAYECYVGLEVATNLYSHYHLNSTQSTVWNQYGSFYIAGGAAYAPFTQYASALGVSINPSLTSDRTVAASMLISTSFDAKFHLYTNNSSGTSYIKNLKATFYYMPIGTVTASSALVST